MRRRDLLALSGPLFAGLAGCLSPFDAEAGPESATRTGDPAASNESATQRRSPTTDATTDPGSSTTPSAADAAVSVETDALQPGVVTMTTPDSIGVRRDDGQFLFLDVAADGEVRPAHGDFTFRFAGTSYEPVAVEYPWRLWRAYGEENWEYSESGDGILLFQLPESARHARVTAAPDSTGTPLDSPETVEAVLTWPGGEWTPGESVHRRLVAPHPPVSVSFDVTEEIPTHESPTVTVTVRNDGDVPGRFVAGLNRSGPRVAHTPVERISFPVPAGETETWELTDYGAGAPSDSEQVGNGEPNMTYYLSWADGGLSRHVRYVE